MDPLSITVNVTALVSFVADVKKLVTEIYDTVKPNPRLLQAISEDLDTLKSILEELKVRCRLPEMDPATDPKDINGNSSRLSEMAYFVEALQGTPTTRSTALVGRLQGMHDEGDESGAVAAATGTQTRKSARKSPGPALPDAAAGGRRRRQAQRGRITASDTPGKRRRRR